MFLSILAGFWRNPGPDRSRRGVLVAPPRNVRAAAAAESTRADNIRRRLLSSARALVRSPSDFPRGTRGGVAAIRRRNMNSRGVAATRPRTIHVPHEVHRALSAGSTDRAVGSRAAVDAPARVVAVAEARPRGLAVAAVTTCGGAASPRRPAASPDASDRSRLADPGAASRRSAHHPRGGRGVAATHPTDDPAPRSRRQHSDAARVSLRRSRRGVLPRRRASAESPRGSRGGVYSSRHYPSTSPLERARSRRLVVPSDYPGRPRRRRDLSRRNIHVAAAAVPRPVHGPSADHPRLERGGTEPSKPAASPTRAASPRPRRVAAIRAV